MKTIISLMEHFSCGALYQKSEKKRVKTHGTSKFLSFMQCWIYLYNLWKELCTLPISNLDLLVTLLNISDVIVRSHVNNCGSRLLVSIAQKTVHPFWKYFFILFQSTGFYIKIVLKSTLFIERKKILWSTDSFFLIEK